MKKFDVAEILKQMHEIDAKDALLGMTGDQSTNADEAQVQEVYQRSDTGNAMRLVYHHGQDLRFVASRGWYVWNGRCWERADSDVEGMSRAKDSVRWIYREATFTDSEQFRRSLVDWGRRSEATSALKAMIENAMRWIFRGGHRVAGRARPIH